MQHLNRLSQIVNAASTVVELARSSQTYNFNVNRAATCYLHVAGGAVHIARHAESQIAITAQLQAPFAWRIAAEQDEAGVYFVALRRPVVGAMAAAIFFVAVPHDAYLVLKLDHTRLCLEDLDGELELSPKVSKLSITAHSS